MLDICLTNDQGYVPVGMQNITILTSVTTAFTDSEDLLPPFPVPLGNGSLARLQNLSLSDPDNDIFLEPGNDITALMEGDLSTSLVDNISTPYYPDYSASAAPCLRLNLSAVSFWHITPGLTVNYNSGTGGVLGIRVSFAALGWAPNPLTSTSGELDLTADLPGGQYAYVNLAAQTPAPSADPEYPPGPYADCSNETASTAHFVAGFIDSLVCDAVSIKVRPCLTCCAAAACKCYLCSGSFIYLEGTTCAQVPYNSSTDINIAPTWRQTLLDRKTRHSTKVSCAPCDCMASQPTAQSVCYVSLQTFSFNVESSTVPQKPAWVPTHNASTSATMNASSVHQLDLHLALTANPVVVCCSVMWQQLMRRNLSSQLMPLRVFLQTADINPLTAGALIGTYGG